MWRVFLYGTLIIGIAYIGTGSFGAMGTIIDSGLGQVIRSMQEIDERTTNDIIAHYKNAILSTQNDFTITDIETTLVDLNEDGVDDIIAIMHSGKTCGTGGCLATIFLKTESGELRPLPFTYALRTIDVLTSMTNGMHDIRINGDTTSTMVWDGTTYVLEQI